MISTATNPVTATVTVGTAPSGVAVTPNGSLAYVGQRQFGHGERDHTATNAVTDTGSPASLRPVGGDRPHGLHAYVTNEGGGVSVIAISPIAQVAPFAARSPPPSPTAATTSPGNTGAITYVTTSASADVAVSATGAVTSPHHPGRHLHGVGNRFRPVRRQRHLDVHLERGDAADRDRGGPRRRPDGGGTAVTVTGTGFEAGSGGTPPCSAPFRHLGVGLSTTTCVFGSPAQAPARRHHRHQRDGHQCHGRGRPVGLSRGHTDESPGSPRPPVAPPALTSSPSQAPALSWDRPLSLSGPSAGLGQLFLQPSTSCTATSPGESAGVVDVTVTTPLRHVFFELF